VSWPSFQTPRRRWVAHRAIDSWFPTRQQEHGPHPGRSLPAFPVTTSFSTLNEWANTSSASILLAVHDAVQEGRIDRPCASSPRLGPARWVGTSSCG